MMTLKRSNHKLDNHLCVQIKSQRDVYGNRVGIKKCKLIFKGVFSVHYQGSIYLIDYCAVIVASFANFLCSFFSLFWYNYFLAPGQSPTQGTLMFKAYFIHQYILIKLIFVCVCVCCADLQRGLPDSRQCSHSHSISMWSENQPEHRRRECKGTQRSLQD